MRDAELPAKFRHRLASSHKLHSFVHDRTLLPRHSSSLLLTHIISSAMLGVIRIEPPVFALLTTLLAFVAAMAVYIPARWATKVDPMDALRCD